MYIFKPGMKESVMQIIEIHICSKFQKYHKLEMHVQVLCKYLSSDPSNLCKTMSNIRKYLCEL